MAKKYEAALVLSLSGGEEAAASLFEKFKTLISENGTVEKVDEWGKRTLAYPVNDETEGAYYIVTFESGPEFPAELDRVAKITDGVLRVLIVTKRAEEKSEGKK